MSSIIIFNGLKKNITFEFLNAFEGLGLSRGIQPNSLSLEISV